MQIKHLEVLDLHNYKYTIYIYIILKWNRTEILELKGAGTEMNSLEGFNSRFEQT